MSGGQREGDNCNGEVRVNFTYDQDQEALANHARRLFEDASSWEIVKSAEPLGFSAELWAFVRQTGLCGISVEEWSGGQGGSLLDAAIVIEEAGRHGVPVPIVEQIVVGRLASHLRSIPAETAEAIATGAVIGTIALEPAEAGSWRFVPAGAVAEVVCGLDGDRLVMVAEEPPMSAIPNLACSPIAHRDSVDSESVGLTRDLRKALDEWRLLTAAELVGIADSSLRMGVDYTTERRQFGHPIGWYQAIQHPLAEQVAPIDAARLLVAKAAWACDRYSADRSLLATMAFVAAGNAARRASSVSMHCHGGYGVMAEHDIQLLYRRALGWSLIAGDPFNHLLHVAECLYDPVPTRVGELWDRGPEHEESLAL
jgi:alkylation response protein AidB-like acyl-CoA dehydrogenase